MTYSTEHSINSIMDVLKPLIERLSDEDKKRIGQAIGLQEQTEAGLEKALNSSSTGVPVYTSDPVNQPAGSIWFNSTDNKFRGRDNGANVDLN